MRAQDRSKWRQLVETAMLTDGRATRWWWWWWVSTALKHTAWQWIWQAYTVILFISINLFIMFITHHSRWPFVGIIARIRITYLSGKYRRMVVTVRKRSCW